MLEYSILQHSSLAKTLSELLNEAGCYDVVLEPSLQQLTGEVPPSDLLSVQEFLDTISTIPLIVAQHSERYS